MKEIDEKLGKAFAYESLLTESKKYTREAFYNSVTGVFSMTIGGNDYTVLGNSLAILSGLTSKKENEAICEKIANGDLSDCSLSMKGFKFDALLATDKAKWQGHVRDEIRKDYGKMVENGNTVWETSDGASAFDNAGSLCHGWSSVPILYLSMQNSAN